MEKIKNRRSKPKVKYQGFALDVLLIDAIKKHIKNNPDYRSVTDFVRKSVMLKMDIDNGKVSLPGFQDDTILKDNKKFIKKYIEVIARQIVKEELNKK